VPTINSYNYIIFKRPGQGKGPGLKAMYLYRRYAGVETPASFRKSFPRGMNGWVKTPPYQPDNYFAWLMYGLKPIPFMMAQYPDLGFDDQGRLIEV